MRKLYFSGVNSKKILLSNTPTLDVPVPATRGRVNDASLPVMLIPCCYELRRAAPYLEKGMRGLQFHSKTRNIGGFAACRQVAKHLFMRYVGSSLGKVARA